METVASAEVNVNRIDSETKSETNGGGYEERVKVDRKKFEQMINGKMFCAQFLSAVTKFAFFS